MTPVPSIPPIGAQALTSAVPFIQRLLRGALGVEDMRVAVDGVTLRIEMDPSIVRELRPEIQEYLRIEGVKATAQLLVAWATLRDSATRAQEAQTRARATDVLARDLRVRQDLQALLEEDVRLQRQLLAAAEQDAQARQGLRSLLTEETRLKMSILDTLDLAGS